MGAGEGAFDVTEEFAFEQILGDRRAIDLDQWLNRALTSGMDGTRHHLLAHTGLAEHQDTGRCRGYRLNLRQGAPQGLAPADYLAEVGRDIDFLAQIVALKFQLPLEVLDLLIRRFALTLDRLALGDVAEDHNRAADRAVALDRRAGVFDGYSRSVGVPEHFMVHAMHLTVR